MRITIPGRPVAKRRPRFVRRGKFVSAYNDQQTEEGRFLLSAREQINGQVIDGPVVVSATFYMPIPKSTPKYKRAMMIAGEMHHTKKPDLDNLVKFALDCLNGEAYRDDSMVVGLRDCFKRYSQHPRTVIEIVEV